MRWKQYGAPREPMPEQQTLNKLVADITGIGLVRAITIEGIPAQYEKTILPHKRDRAKLGIVLKCSSIEMEALPVYWCTQGEIKNLLKQRQDKDEQAVIAYLANQSDLVSVSCRIYMEWDLARETVKKILNALSYDRMLQVTLGSVIGATRFKIPEGKGLGMVACPKCGQLDSWDHCKECYEVTAPVRGNKNEKKWLSEVDSVINKLCTPNPGKNEPLPRAEETSKTGKETTTPEEVNCDKSS